MPEKQITPVKINPAKTFPFMTQFLLSLNVSAAEEEAVCVLVPAEAASVVSYLDAVLAEAEQV